MTDNNYGVCTDVFAGETLRGEAYERFAREVKTATQVFLHDLKSANRFLLDTTLTPESSCTELDRWCASDEGQRLLTHLTKDVIWHIKAAGQFAMPAHDLHQIFAKDAIEALRFAAMESPSGYKQIFPIAALCHDIGRLLEGKLFDPTRPYGQWIPHAELSYLLLNKILSQDAYHAMPYTLKAHLLYAVLGHSGTNTQTYIARATQVCDRWSGLHGAEGFFRAATFVPHIMGGMVGYPPDKKYCGDLPTYNHLPSAMMVLEFFARNMYPDIGDRHSYHRERMMVENIALMLKYCEEMPDICRIMFAPETGVDVTGTTHKMPLDMDLVDEAKELAKRYPYDKTAISAYELTDAFCVEAMCPIGAIAITDDIRRCLQTSFAAMEPAERVAFHNTLRMAQDLRQEACNRDWDVVAKALFAENPICRFIAQESTNFMADSTRDSHWHFDYAQGFRANTLG